MPPWSDSLFRSQTRVAGGRLCYLPSCGHVPHHLHKTLYFLRHILCPTAGEARQCPYPEFDGELVLLVPHLVGQVDAEQFEAQAARAHASAEPALYAAALDLYTGDLLPEDLYEDWAIKGDDQYGCNIR